jgi:PBP1b-binding outer membrane lipoprotein LpoB
MFGIHSKTLSSAALALGLVLFLSGCSDTDKTVSEQKIEMQKQALGRQK